MSDNEVPMNATGKIDVEAFNSWMYAKHGVRISSPENIHIYARDDISYPEAIYLYRYDNLYGEVPVRFVTLDTPTVTIDIPPPTFGADTQETESAGFTLFGLPVVSKVDKDER